MSTYTFCNKLNISTPAFLLDTNTHQIIEKNSLYTSTFLSKSALEQKKLIGAVVSRLEDLNSMSFHYNLPVEDGYIDSRVWAQYNKAKDSILVILDYKSNEFLQPIDYYMISDFAPAGVAYIHIEEDHYRLIYNNRSFTELLGYPEDEKSALIGHNFLDCIAKEDLLHIDQYRIIKNDNQPFSITATLIGKVGSNITVNLSGRFIHYSKQVQELTIIVSPHAIAQTSHQNSLSEFASDNPYFMVFRYDFVTESISFLGGFLKRITGRMCITYSIEDIYMNKTTLQFDSSQVIKAIEAAKRGKKLQHIFKIIGKGNTIYWVKVEYDFIQDAESKNIATVGRVYDISEEQAAKEFYDKAIALWHTNHDDCESAITINVTEQVVVDGFSNLIPQSKLHAMSLQEYLDAVCPYILNKANRSLLRQQMTPKKLIASAKNQNHHFSHDFEVSYKDEHLWLRLNVTLLKNPKTDHVMALLKWTNISTIVIYKQIHQFLLSKKFDFICLVFAKTDSFSMVMNAETTKILPMSIVNGYEAFLQDIIHKYSLPEDANHLQFCFSLKNLKNQLSINSTYSFIGHGLYPDGSPTVKYHTFQYLDPKRQIMLYTREDITNQAEVLSFKINSNIHRIPFKDILYVESFGKKSKVTTYTEEFEVNEMLSNLQARLPGRKFMRCHRCYIVRNAAIKQIIQNYAVLLNGSKIPISRKYISFLSEQSLSINNSGLDPSI